ncbi:MAG: cyclophilin-like fold protein [Bacilli bacterium]
MNNVKIGIELESNSSVDALVDILKETNITYSAHDYGGFEKVGDIGYTLPQNNTSITTEPGDVILYQGTSICLYYDTNTWSFTKIGHIYHYSQEQLKELLKADQGDIEITLSLV